MHICEFRIFKSGDCGDKQPLPCNDDFLEL